MFTQAEPKMRWGSTSYLHQALMHTCHWLWQTTSRSAIKSLAATARLEEGFQLVPFTSVIFPSIIGFDCSYICRTDSVSILKHGDWKTTKNRKRWKKNLWHLDARRAGWLPSIFLSMLLLLGCSPSLNATDHFSVEHCCRVVSAHVQVQISLGLREEEGGAQGKEFELFSN